MSQSRRRRSHNAKRTIRRGGCYTGVQNDWRKSADRTLDLFLCVSHMVAAVILIAEHLL